MFSKIVLLFFVTIVVVSALTEREQFEEFKKNFNKKYATPEEEQQRFENFKESLKRVAEQNAKHAAGESSHTSAINQFADLSREEWLHRNHGILQHDHQQHH